MRRLGQYEIIRRLGAGAMGEVYLAEHALMRAHYAVKVLPGELSSSDEFQRRFVNEARVMAGLRHPNIVQVHTMDVAGDVHYIVMDFVSPDGKSPQSLDDLLRARGGRLPAEEAGRILEQVCEALIHSHEHGVVHCDIKPANVLLDKNNMVRVSDFGLAKIMGGAFIQQSIAMSISGSIGAGQTIAPKRHNVPADDSLGAGDTLGDRGSSRAQSIVGTFHYMPPEVQEGGEWTPRGDIYSLGVLAYVLLTGTRPVGRWKLPGQLINGMPACWDTLIEQSLETVLDARFPTVSDMLAAIRHPGVTVRPPLKKQAPGTVGAVSEVLWYYSDGDQEKGPVSEAALLQQVTSSTMVWRPGLDAWAAAGTVPELRAKVRPPLRAPAAPARTESSPVKQAELRAGETRTFSGIEMVWCPPGEFWMGSPSGEEGRDDDEKQHRVTLTRGFWLGKYEVTQSQWESVMGNNPSQFKGDGKLPVERVSWDDCQAFIRRLNGKSGEKFRLPTEAEWEYACRAGTTTRFGFGNSDGDLSAHAWYEGNSGSRTHAVGGKKANAWGLHDMHGNVWEWCHDWYGDYPSGAVTDPAGPASGSRRVSRGGCWINYPLNCRSAGRNRRTPVSRFINLGFRLALPAVQ